MQNKQIGSINQLKAGAILNYIVIVLNILVTLLYTPYMLRMMGQNEYGLYALVASVIAYLTVLDFGIGNAIVRYTAKFRAEGKITEQYEMFGMFFLLYVVIGIIALSIGTVVVFNVDCLFAETMSLAELLKARVMILILVFNLAFTFPMSIFGSIITAYERFTFPKVINIVRILLNTGVMIVLLSMGYKAIALVVIQTIFNVFTLIINFIYCKKNLRIQILFSNLKLSLLKEVAIYSFWILLDVVMNQIYWNTGQFVLGAISGTAAVAVFAVAIQMESMYMQFSTAISSVFLPKVTSMVSQRNDKEEISSLFIRTGRIQNIIMSFMLFGFIVFGKRFIELWAGEDYSDAYYMTVAFFVALYIPLIQNLGITILQARNEMKFRSLLYICIAVVALVIQIILAKSWGGIGCALAIAGALFVGQGVIMNIYYKNKQSLDIPKFWKEILKMDIVPILIVGIFSVILRFAPFVNTWTSLLLTVAVYVCIYAPLYYMFSMNEEEKNLIVKPILRIFSK